ncbi:YkvA family protein [Arthrobacter sp. TMN-50]
MAEHAGGHRRTGGPLYGAAPDLLRLLRSLAADKSQSAGVRAGVVLLLVYLLMPLDVVPDFLTVIGYADDVIIVALMLRFIIRRAGLDALVKHWPGNARGLQVVMRLGAPGPDDSVPRRGSGCLTVLP